ncbi:MAG: peptide chain release factor 1, partial [Clostridia bacterium]|nr:peptide chain release factor 1 [Clostridia bacterium]
YNTKYRNEYDANRKSLVGTGDRSERIRTYNFPQGRITDHRIGYTIYSLQEFLMGDIDGMVDALAIADREAKLSSAD